MEQRHVLPTLKELHDDPEKAFKNDQLNLLLNQPPHNKWIKNHPLATVVNDKSETVKSRYIPIDKIEFLLTRIFQKWKVEIMREGVMFNSVYVTVRLWYLNPINGEWEFHDGAGAKSVQTDKGFSAADLSHIKDAGVQMAFPAAVSYAIKDAAEHLGTVFGRDLNRRDGIMFSGAYNQPEQPEKEKGLPPVITLPTNTPPVGTKVTVNKPDVEDQQVEYPM